LVCAYSLVVTHTCQLNLFLFLWWLQKCTVC
jgi:hypothetical protein